MAKRTSIQEVDTATGPANTYAANSSGYNRNKKLEDVVWFLLTIVLVIMGVRFLLVLLGASSAAGFVRFWYNLSQPFVAPFTGMFGTTNTYTSYGTSRFELETLFGMLIYSLVAYLIILGIRLFARDNERRV